jgi:hypothetical protein
LGVVVLRFKDISYGFLDTNWVEEERRKRGEWSYSCSEKGEKVWFFHIVDL